VAENDGSTRELLTWKEYREVHPFFEALRIISGTTKSLKARRTFPVAGLGFWKQKHRRI
jgi:hypothetical protein